MTGLLHALSAAIMLRPAERRGQIGCAPLNGFLSTRVWPCSSCQALCTYDVNGPEQHEAPALPLPSADAPSGFPHPLSRSAASCLLAAGPQPAHPDDVPSVGPRAQGPGVAGGKAQAGGVGTAGQGREGGCWLGARAEGRRHCRRCCSRAPGPPAVWLWDVAACQSTMPSKTQAQSKQLKACRPTSLLICGT